MDLSNTKILLLVAGSLLFSGCGEDDVVAPELEIPTSYISADYAANVTAEQAVISELATMTAAANAAEANAQTTTVSAIDYPSALAAVTVPSYKSLVDGWLVELVKSANDDDGFQNPGSDSPAEGEEGGLLGSRLLDEYGLELEQMVQKGSFGAALYNHAVSVIDGDITSATIDQLVEIHGTDPTFSPEEATAAATYSLRRSNQTTQTGAFYDIKNSLLKAQAAVAAGSAFDAERDQALADYLLAWEKSNFATVIFYCNATKIQLAAADGDPEKLGDALHAYAEGVGFAHGFKGISNKLITDDQIDAILNLLLAPEGQAPESFKFINDASLISNLDQIVTDLQRIYSFSNSEVSSFFENNPS